MKKNHTLEKYEHFVTTGVTDFVRIHSILKWGDSSKYNNSQYKQVVCVWGGGVVFSF